MSDLTKFFKNERAKTLYSARFYSEKGWDLNLKEHFINADPSIFHEMSFLVSNGYYISSTSDIEDLDDNCKS